MREKVFLFFEDRDKTYYEQKNKPQVNSKLGLYAPLARSNFYYLILRLLKRLK